MQPCLVRCPLTRPRATSQQTAQLLMCDVPMQVLKDAATGEELTEADVEGMKEGDKVQKEVEKEDGDYDPANPAEEKAEEVPPDDAAAQEAVAEGMSVAAAALQPHGPCQPSLSP